MGEVGVGSTLDTPGPPNVNPFPVDLPLRSPQFMPPPPNPPRIDEDETMEIVPDSEPSRATDGPMSSLHLPQPTNRVPTIAEIDNETVPESSSEMDNETSEKSNPNQIAQDTEMQETEAETERDDDPMDSSQPLVRQRTKRPPKLHLEEEEDQTDQEVLDDAMVPETEDEVPLATVVKTTKVAPKPSPPRGRRTRNKRPIVYTESPDTSENEVSAAEFSSILATLSDFSGR